jgi:hypothetical protein
MNGGCVREAVDAPVPRAVLLVVWRTVTEPERDERPDHQDLANRVAGGTL